MPADLLKELLSRPGDLVPVVAPGPVKVVEKLMLPQLLSELVDKRAAMSKRWDIPAMVTHAPSLPLCIMGLLMGKQT